MADGTYLPHGWCLLVLTDGTGTPLAWQWMRGETASRGRSKRARLLRAKTDNRLDKELAMIGKAGLPVVDELGYVPVDEEGSCLLFQVAANAYERQSVVYTTNIEFSGWGRVFGDPNMAAAIIDRTVHHGRMIRFDGDSYRRTHALVEQPHTTKNKRAAGTRCPNGPIPAAHLDQNNTLKRTTST